MSIFLGLILCILGLVAAFPNPEGALDTAVKEPLNTTKDGVQSLIMLLERVLRQISTYRMRIPTKDDVQDVKSLIMSLEEILRARQISTQKRMGNAN